MDRDPLTLWQAIQFGFAWLIFICGICGIVFLVACASPSPARPWDFPTDQVGNSWPPACRRDLSTDTTHVQIHFAPRANMNGANGLFLTFGATDERGVLIGVIILADDLTGDEYADVLHHEKCHAVAGMDWHT